MLFPPQKLLFFFAMLLLPNAGNKPLRRWDVCEWHSKHILNFGNFNQVV